MRHIPFPISFVSSFLVLDDALLLNFIEIDCQRLTAPFNSLIKQCLFGIGGLLWVVETHKCEWLSILTLNIAFKSDILDLTVGFEEIVYLVLVPVFGEVFDVKVASFFRGLVAHSRSCLFD